MDVCYKYEMKTVTCMYCTMLTTGLCCTCAWDLVLVNITVINYGKQCFKNKGK